MNEKSKYINVLDFMQPEYQTTYIVGARGVGKTISSIAESIKHCYENDQKFVYLRRRQTEIDNLGLNLKLLSDLTGCDIHFKTVKDKDTGRKTKMITATKDNKTKDVGYVLALSTSAYLKSTAFSNVWLIIYDEFIDPNGRELKNEVNLFMNFAMTVFRNFDDYKGLFLANATNIFNPYFVKYNMLPKGTITKSRYLKMKIVMYKTSASLTKSREESALVRMYNVANGCNNSDISNKFATKVGFIHKLSGSAVPKATYLLGDTEYGLWKQKRMMIISDKVEPSLKKKIAVDELTSGYVYDTYAILFIADWLSKGNLYFSNESVRGVWLQFLKDRRYI